MSETTNLFDSGVEMVKNESEAEEIDDRVGRSFAEQLQSRVKIIHLFIGVVTPMLGIVLMVGAGWLGIHDKQNTLSENQVHLSEKFDQFLRTQPTSEQARVVQADQFNNKSEIGLLKYQVQQTNAHIDHIDINVQSVDSHMAAQDSHMAAQDVKMAAQDVKLDVILDRLKVKPSIP